MSEAIAEPEKVVNEKVRRIRYECSACEAEDFHKLYPYEPTPPAVNCWKCHAGQGSEMSEMLSRKRGMFPTGEVNDKNEPIEE